MPGWLYWSAVATTSLQIDLVSAGELNGLIPCTEPRSMISANAAIRPSGPELNSS